ncbi:hypothetical protein P9250_30890 [Caballeronia sp. LP006]|uniref:hypothetical protein n=1 Tax=Caballeronia sp. LP006 TaxID=3038552 RepID=UPI00286319AD|nr:hypothetical protein [Caballeronia sp. LP006]MDR5832272.1 hypothetical protein [Caballeronia sp. LP006]
MEQANKEVGKASVATILKWRGDIWDARKCCKCSTFLVTDVVRYASGSRTLICSHFVNEDAAAVCINFLLRKEHKSVLIREPASCLEDKSGAQANLEQAEVALKAMCAFSNSVGHDTGALAARQPVLLPLPKRSTARVRRGLALRAGESRLQKIEPVIPMTEGNTFRL